MIIANSALVIISYNIHLGILRKYMLFAGWEVSLAKHCDGRVQHFQVRGHSSTIRTYSIQILSISSCCICNNREQSNVLLQKRRKKKHEFIVSKPNGYSWKQPPCTSQLFDNLEESIRVPNSRCILVGDYFPTAILHLYVTPLYPQIQG